jgi:hypothetical protein
MARMTTRLQDRLTHTSPGDWLDVVVEIADDASFLARPATERSAGASRSDRYGAMQQQFATASQSVEQAIQDAGGEILGRSALAGALKVRMPVDGIPRLLSLDGVELVDMPRTITRG